MSALKSGYSDGNGYDHAVTSVTTPEPLVPAHVDLRSFSYMALQVESLCSSDFFALSTGDEFKAAVALWCRSWHQIPAGSLPANDRILAHLSHAGPAWPAMREMALHGWVLCSDGRYYHPLIAAKAKEAWGSKTGGQTTRSKGAEKMRLWRERKAQQRAAAEAAAQDGQPTPSAEADDVPPRDPIVTVTEPPCNGNGNGNVPSMRGRGITEGTESEESKQAGQPAREPEEKVAHLNPRLTDPGHLWAGVCKGRFGRSESGASVPMAGARGDVEWELLPAAKRVCAAAMMASGWRGDWGTLVEWLERGWDLNDHIMPAIERTAGRAGYSQPAKLRYFTPIIEEFISRKVRAG